jgi:hypothetical protein
VKAQLVDVELQRIRRKRASLGELIVDNLVGAVYSVYPIEVASQEKRPDMRREGLLQEVGGRKLPLVGFPVAGEELLSFLVLAFSQRVGGFS